jgi:hypothetical protein
MGDKDVKGTILDVLLPNLLMSLCMFRFNLQFIVNTIDPIMKLMKRLNSLKVPGARVKQSTMRESYESDHPYPNDANL